MTEFDTMPQLDEVIAQDIEAPQGARRTFTVHDEQSATWTADKLRKHHDRIAEIARVAAERRTAVDEWERAQTAQERGAVTHLEGLLDEWARPIIAARKKDESKTITLLDGTKISYRVRDKQFVFSDRTAMDRITEFIEELMPGRYTEPKLRWGDLKVDLIEGDPDKQEFPGRLYIAVAKAEGEIEHVPVPAVTVVSQSDSVTIKLP